LDIESKINKHSKKRPKGAGKVAFLAVKNHVAEALSKGHSKMAIWKALAEDDSFPVKYRQFVYYVEQFGLTPKGKDHEQP